MGLGRVEGAWVKCLLCASLCELENKTSGGTATSSGFIPLAILKSSGASAIFL